MRPDLPDRRPVVTPATGTRPRPALAGTGYVWAFLDEARDPSLITPGALVVAGDEDAPAVAAVVDLVGHPNGTIVHLDVLPGVLDNYLALARRVASAA